MMWEIVRSCPQAVAEHDLYCLSEMVCPCVGFIRTAVPVSGILGYDLAHTKAHHTVLVG